MYFSTSGVTTELWIPPLISFILSFFGSMAGISGAFLLLPFQMSVLGYTHPSVSATNQLYNIVAIPSGVYRYWREGRMVWPLTWTVVAGTLPGVLIGAIVRVTTLRDPNNFKLFAAGVLCYIGGRMALDLLAGKGQKAKESEQRFHGGVRAQQNQAAVDAKTQEVSADRSVRITHQSLRRFGYSFQGEQFEVPVMGVFILCFIVGIVGGIYGIGGGAIVAPFLVTFIGLPIYTIGGATLMGTFVTSIAGVTFYSALAPFYPKVSVAPDWILGILFGLGGMAGMYLGARCQKFIPAQKIKWMLVVIILSAAGKYLFEFMHAVVR